MKNFVWIMVVMVLLAACNGSKGRVADAASGAVADTTVSIEVEYATEFAVRDSAGIRLVDIGGRHHFALIPASVTVPEGSPKGSSEGSPEGSITAPEGYTPIRVPIQRALCMTALQLSNFTILDAHNFISSITSTKNLFNEDIRQRVEDGRIVKIGMEGNFDTEMVLAANPDVIFISPSKRGGYDAIKETGITLVPHLGYKELDPLGQAEWIKFVGLFIGKEAEANAIFADIEERYNRLKSQVERLEGERPTIISGEMHYGSWHAVGGKNYLAQIFRDAGADYVIHDDETSGENLEFEKAYALAANADYWRILNSFPGDFSYEALRARSSTAICDRPPTTRYHPCNPMSSSRISSPFCTPSS